VSGTDPGADAELMMPSNKGSGWRPPREPSVQLPSERKREPAQRTARWALDKLLGRRLEDD
jgi:hypothetical protein